MPNLPVMDGFKFIAKILFNNIVDDKFDENDDYKIIQCAVN